MLRKNPFIIPIIFSHFLCIILSLYSKEKSPIFNPIFLPEATWNSAISVLRHHSMILNPAPHTGENLNDASIFSVASNWFDHNFSPFTLNSICAVHTGNIPCRETFRCVDDDKTYIAIAPLAHTWSISQVLEDNWPAWTRVFLLNDKGGREERLSFPALTNLKGRGLLEPEIHSTVSRVLANAWMDVLMGWDAIPLPPPPPPPPPPIEIKDKINGNEFI